MGKGYRNLNDFIVFVIFVYIDIFFNYKCSVEYKLNMDDNFCDFILGCIFCGDEFFKWG